jgi:hypothetical protein
VDWRRVAAAAALGGLIVAACSSPATPLAEEAAAVTATATVGSSAAPAKPAPAQPAASPAVVARPSPAAAARAVAAASPAARPAARAAASPVAALPAQADAPAAKPGQAAGGLNQVFGQVTGLASSPPSLTLRTPGGESETFAVLDLTVFNAGPDRPFRFDLVKVGDYVRVREVPLTQARQQAQLSANAKPNGRPLATALSDGQRVARIVDVRPAAELKPGQSPFPGIALAQ